MPTYYKILKENRSCHGGTMDWPLPVKNGRWQPGAWVTHDSPCKICESGLHLTTQPFNWYVWGCECYEAEAGEIFGRDNDKIVTNKVRLLKQIEHPKWWIDTIAFVNSIKKVGWFSNQEIPPPTQPKIKLHAAGAAARAAAWAAAWAAARDVAWDAARAAAWDAARDVAWDAARAAAWAAAGAAAGATAGATAGDAAWATAGATAGDAAWATAGDAAWDAARDAALQARMILTQDLNVDQKHRDHAALRWQIWTLGYGVATDVNGILYCYKKP